MAMLQRSSRLGLWMGLACVGVLIGGCGGGSSSPTPSAVAQAPAPPGPPPAPPSAPAAPANSATDAAANTRPPAANGGLPMPSEASMGSGGGASQPAGGMAFPSGGLPTPSVAEMGSGGGASQPAGGMAFPSGGLPTPSVAGMGSGGGASQPAGGMAFPSGGPGAGTAGQNTPQSAAPALPKIRISKGVAAAQNGGKATNFTLEYAVSEGVLARDLKTLLVIDPAQGDDIVKPVTLKQDGKLTAFFKDVSTDRGPFECYLAVVMGDGTHQAISDKAQMGNSP